MLIEKIELIGFKSFGDKTGIDLHPGITAIVGPNGCGKSNIVDAFKWVLGEQSVKSLRGGKMEDIIFAGSQTKKPRGMAEVSLYVRGIENEGNGKDNVTVVTRRLFRSGDSEYMLNRKTCRLKDIRDIFLDTGLEVKSYSMLEQDRVSAIITSKAEDRRFLIEEVAGVIKYKMRRHEAMNKLEASRGNLARIADIIAEVRRQLNSLDRQARKAERYKKLMGQLKEIEVRIAKRDFTLLSDELTDIISGLAEARQGDASTRAAFSSIEANLESRRIALAEEEKAIQEEQSKLIGTEREMSELNQTVAVSKAEREHLSQSIERLRDQGRENSEKRTSTKDRMEELATSTSTIGAELNNYEEKAAAQVESLQEAEAAIKDREHNLDNRRRDSFKVTEELGSTGNELQKHTTMLESLEKKTSELKIEAEDITASLTQAGQRGQEIQAGLLNKNNELMIFRQERDLITVEIEALREKLNQLGSSTTEAREEMASNTSRMESLREMDVSEAAEEDLKDSVNILAAISNIIEPETEYERAIESALREAAGGFVVPAYNDIASALSVLESKGTQRTAFFPSEQSSPRTQGKPEGALAMAWEVVKIKDGFEDTVKSLLGNTVIAKDITQAIALKDGGMTVVTLTGEVLIPDGAVIAGKSRGILALKRQIRELESEIEKKRARLTTLARETTETQNTLTEKRSKLDELNERTVEAEKTVSLLRHQAEQNTQESERFSRKQAHLKIELEEALKEKENLSNHIATKQEEIKALESNKNGIEVRIEDLLKELNQLRSEFESKRAESVELKLMINSSRERLNSIVNEKQATERLSHELADKETLLEKEIAATRERIQKFEMEENSKEEELKILAVKAQAFNETISAMRDKMAGQSGDLKEAETELRDLRFKIDAAAQRIGELDVKRAEHSLKIENIVSNITNSYSINLKELEAGEVTDEDMELMPELKAKLEKMGSVSLGSIEEYEELKERYDFLSKQKEDLEKSIAELEEAIARINATTRKKLREAYDALKAKFSEVFVALFGGGMAELALTNPNNILETGIEIIAQPPGKRLQNITLLSGGERTLTALALLFSGFLIKPTPLCILDEADAALDESNTAKFSQLIKELSGEIQFICVTHNKVTMESADYIYGITMEEPGNSKTISMQLSSK